MYFCCAWSAEFTFQLHINYSERIKLKFQRKKQGDDLQNGFHSAAGMHIKNLAYIVLDQSRDSGRNLFILLFVVSDNVANEASLEFYFILQFVTFLLRGRG